MSLKKNESKESVKHEKSNFFLSTLMSLIFDFFKGAVHDFQNNRKISKIDKFEREFSNLEHIVIKAEEKISDVRKEVEKLKTSLMIQNFIVILLLIIVILGIFM